MSANISMNLTVFAKFFEVCVALDMPPDLLIEEFARWCAEDIERTKEWMQIQLSVF